MTSLKNAERAKKVAIDRAKTKLFIAHYINGCPVCKHAYRPSDDEIAKYLAMREKQVPKSKQRNRNRERNDYTVRVTLNPKLELFTATIWDEQGQCVAVARENRPSGHYGI
jgi:hypothetical protein